MNLNIQSGALNASSSNPAFCFRTNYAQYVHHTNDGDDTMSEQRLQNTIYIGGSGQGSPDGPPDEDRD